MKWPEACVWMSFWVAVAIGAYSFFHCLAMVKS